MTAILAMGGFRRAGKLVIESESLRGATAGKPAAISPWLANANPPSKIITKLHLIFRGGGIVYSVFRLLVN